MTPELILIIGTSSAGKTTLAKALQRAMSEHYLRVSLDMFFRMLNPDYGGGINGPLSADGFHYVNKDVDTSIGYGDIGLRILTGMVASTSALLDSGNKVIFDDMLLDRRHGELWQQQLLERSSFVIRMTAPLSVLEQREIERDQAKGLARNHVESNSYMTADLQIDSSKHSTDQQLRMIMKEFQQERCTATR